MRKRIAAVLTLALLGTSFPAMAIDQPEVNYVNGTIKSVAENAGTFDTTSQAVLELRFGPGQVSIPYAQIKSVAYREENRFRLGVLPAIAVGLLKARTKSHFVTIAWTDTEGSQVVTLKAAKARAVGLLQVIRARAPDACKPRPGNAGSCFIPE